jgi:histidinol dehydrogenase
LQIVVRWYLVKDRAEAIELINQVAPEHLEFVLMMLN